MLLVTEHNFCSKALTSQITPNNFIADSGATCHIHGSLKGIFNLKSHVTDVMVANNETISSVSKRKYKELFVQKDGSSFELTLQDVLFWTKKFNMVLVNFWELKFILIPSILQ
jgi:hypothetical protein